MQLPVQYTVLTTKEKKLVREEYIRLQGDKCYHCKGLLSEHPIGENSLLPLNLGLFPSGFLNNPIHLHHCHDTGWTIGAVHAKCNGILWQYYDE